MKIVFSDSRVRNRHGFTLMETVIAIGVVAVLLTTFLAVFGPASAGIRRALSAQEAGRLTNSLERELSSLRRGLTMPTRMLFTRRSTGFRIPVSQRRRFSFITTGQTPSESGRMPLWNHMALPTEGSRDGTLFSSRRCVGKGMQTPISVKTWTG